MNDNDIVQKENIRPRQPTVSPDGRKKPPVSLSNKSFGSSIPLLRRARSNLTRNGAATQSAQGTKWDEFMGEPTNGPTGRPAQVKPSTFNDPFARFPTGQQGASAHDDQRFGVQVSISGGADKPKKSTFAEKAAKFGREALPEVRPPWKGGSGRAALVEPVRSTRQDLPARVYTAVRSPSPPYRRSNRTRSRAAETSKDLDETKSVDEGSRTPIASKSTNSVNTISAPAPLNIQKQTTSAPAANKLSAVPARKPVSIFGQPLTLEPAFNEFYSRSSSSLSSHGSLTGSSVSAEDKTEEEPKSHFSWSTFAESESEYGDGQDTPVQMYPGKPQFGQAQDPVSRFSWTTVATNTTSQQTPPSSPAANTSRSQKLPSPIMMRRRPLPSMSSMSSLRNLSDASNSNTGDSTPNMNVETIDYAQSKTGTTSSSPASANNKALPPRPEMTNKQSSHMDVLQAKSDELDLRVSNIQRVISELEKVERASPLDVTEKMRKENRKKLDTVRTTLEEAQRERHEVGMALARAWSRAHKEEGTASALWLRRVTG